MDAIFQILPEFTVHNSTHLTLLAVLCGVHSSIRHLQCAG